jgi:hypothetical protein
VVVTVLVELPLAPHADTEKATTTRIVRAITGRRFAVMAQASLGHTRIPFEAKDVGPRGLWR